MDEHDAPDFAIITKLNGKFYDVKNMGENVNGWHCIECGTPQKFKKIKCDSIITDYSDILFENAWRSQYECEYDPNIHGTDIKKEMMSIHETYTQYICESMIYQYTTTEDIIARIKQRDI
jgi:hypothetical protein